MTNTGLSWIGWLRTAAVPLWLLAAGVAQAEDAASLLQKYEASLIQRIALAMDVEIDWKHTLTRPHFKEMPKRVYTDHFDARVYRDVNRLDLDFILQAVDKRPDKTFRPPTGQSLRGHTLAQDHLSWWFWTRSTKKSADWLRTTPVIDVMTQEKSPDNGCSNNVATGVLDGYSVGGGGLNWAELFRLPGSQFSAQGEQKIEGALCQRLSGTTPYGKITLDLAVNQGYVPLQVTFTKTANDRWSERDPTLRDNKIEDLAASAWTMNLKDVIVSKVGEVYVPVGGKMVTRWKLAEDADNEEVVTFKRAKVEVQPNFKKFPKAFVFDAPNRLRVQNKLLPKTGKYFIWNNGGVEEGDPYLGPNAPVQSVIPETTTSFVMARVLDGLIVLFAASTVIAYARGALRRFRVRKQASAAAAPSATGAIG